MLKNESRRYFFQAAAKATACISASSLPGFGLLGLGGLEPSLSAQETPAPPFVSLPASELERMVEDLRSKPGGKTVIASKQLPFNARLISEQATGGKEFEFHEHTDHIVQVLEGSTHFDVGGTAENQHQVKPAEWLAPGSKGSTPIDMSKGDMLFIPRGTPHKRTTKESAVLMLISVTGPTPG